MLERFLALADALPGAAALIEGSSGAVTTRAQLLARSRAVAAELAGLREGDLLAVKLPNSVDFVATILAALEKRLIIVPIDRDATESEAGAILAHFGVKGFVHRGGISSRAGAQRPSIPSDACLI